MKHLPLGVHDAAGTPASRRLVAELGAKGTFDPRPYPTRGALDRALVAGEVSAATRHPARLRPRAATTPAPARRRPQVQVIYDGGEAVLAGNAEGFLRALIAATGARLRADAAPAPTGVEVVPRALFNPTLDGMPFMVAGTFGFVLSFLTTLITAVSIVNERLIGHLRAAPGDARDLASRSCSARSLPLGAVFAFDVVLMVLVAGFLLGTSGRRAASSSSSSCRRSTS